MASRITAVITASCATAFAYCGVEAAATAAAPLATRAAVAESAPTTSWRDEASTANRRGGRSAQ